MNHARTIGFLAVVISLSAVRVSAGEAEGEREGIELRHRVGLEYEYTLSHLFGTGALIEYAGGDHDSTVASAALYLHPLGNWVLLLAPGVEHEDGENEFLLRTGISYEFEFEPWTLAPGVDVDFVDGDESWVFGLTIGRKF